MGKMREWGEAGGEGYAADERGDYEVIGEGARWGERERCSA